MLNSQTRSCFNISLVCSDTFSDLSSEQHSTVAHGTIVSIFNFKCSTISLAIRRFIFSGNSFDQSSFMDNGVYVTTRQRNGTFVWTFVDHFQRNISLSGTGRFRLGYSIQMENNDYTSWVMGKNILDRVVVNSVWLQGPRLNRVDCRRKWPAYIQLQCEYDQFVCPKYFEFGSEDLG